MGIVDQKRLFGRMNMKQLSIISQSDEVNLTYEVAYMECTAYQHHEVLSM